MSEYLSKEEIKQWRSSLEKITLEEFAARLGKKIEEAKPTNDLIDIVFHGRPTVSGDSDWNINRTERLSSIAERSFDREREISVTPFSISKLKLEIADSEPGVKPKKNDVAKSKDTESVAKVEKTAKPKKTVTKKAITKKSTTKKTTKTVSKAKVEETIKNVTEKIKKSAAKAKVQKEPVDELREEVRIVFKKALTDREQKVFNHFAENQNRFSLRQAYRQQSPPEPLRGIRRKWLF